MSQRPASEPKIVERNDRHDVAKKGSSVLAFGVQIYEILETQLNTTVFQTIFSIGSSCSLQGTASKLTH